MPMPKITMTFSYCVYVISSNLVKSTFSFSIDEVLEFDNPTLISCVSVVAALCLGLMNLPSPGSLIQADFGFGGFGVS